MEELVRDVADLYALTGEDLLGARRMGGRQVDRRGEARPSRARHHRGVRARPFARVAVRTRASATSGTVAAQALAAALREHRRPAGGRCRAGFAAVPGIGPVVAEGCGGSTWPTITTAGTVEKLRSRRPYDE